MSRSADAESALAARASRARARRDGRLDAERVAALDELAFEWDPNQQARTSGCVPPRSPRARRSARRRPLGGRQRAAKAGRLPASASRRSTS